MQKPKISLNTEFTNLPIRPYNRFTQNPVQIDDKLSICFSPMSTAGTYLFKVFSKGEKSNKNSNFIFVNAADCDFILFIFYSNKRINKSTKKIIKSETCPEKGAPVHPSGLWREMIWYRLLRKGSVTSDAPITQCHQWPESANTSFTINCQL